MRTALAIYHEIAMVNEEIDELQRMLSVTEDYTRNYSNNVKEVREDIQRRISQLEKKRVTLLNVNYIREEDIR